jgi:hypothetical protein
VFTRIPLSGLDQLVHTSYYLDIRLWFLTCAAYCGAARYQHGSAGLPLTFRTGPFDRARCELGSERDTRGPYSHAAQASIRIRLQAP